MNLLPRFKEFVSQHDLFQPKDKLLLAVSGGVDSVVLCELCKQSGYDFVIAHCNFRLRDKESERDKEFVGELAKKYGVEFFVKDFDTEKYAKENKLSIQEAARELRYEWFFTLIGNKQYAIGKNEESSIADCPLLIANWLLTAHHADDNIETVLMNFFKGTGIAGLRGMLPKQNRIARPLLFARKEEILAFAKENDLKWVEDSSNESDKYSRNYLRHQLIPLVEKIYPEAINNLSDNLERFRDIEELYWQAIHQHKEKLLEKKGNEIHIPVLKLKKSMPLRTIVYEIIKEYGFTANQTEEVIHLLDADSGKYISSSSHRIIKNRNWLIIAPCEERQAGIILIEEGTRNLELGIGNLVVEVFPNSEFLIPNSSTIACLDADEIKFPLLLRKWRQADYFYPLGMKKKKKLSRFFIDQKLSKTDKEKAWVLEMNKKIVWVVGLRLDDRFKITGKTKNILRFTLK